MAVRPTPLVPAGCSLPAQHDQTVQTALRDAEELEEVPHQMLDTLDSLLMPPD